MLGLFFNKMERYLITKNKRFLIPNEKIQLSDISSADYSEMDEREFELFSEGPEDQRMLQKLMVDARHIQPRVALSNVTRPRLTDSVSDLNQTRLVADDSINQSSEARNHGKARKSLKQKSQSHNFIYQF